MTSVQKVRAMAARLDELEPDNAEAATMVLTLTVLRPKLLSMLPENADELDELLLRGALWALSLRGDDAQALEISQANASLEQAS